MTVDTSESESTMATGKGGRLGYWRSQRQSFYLLEELGLPQLFRHAKGKQKLARVAKHPESASVEILQKGHQHLHKKNQEAAQRHPRTQTKSKEKETQQKDSQRMRRNW